MPPARPRPLDDSRSETSSVVANLKEKSILNAPTGAGVSKGKKAAHNTVNGLMKNTGATSNAAGIAVNEADPSLPRTDWTTLSPSILNSYRMAYRLLTSSSHTKPHADILYKSSTTALRAPSAVLARRRLRDLKHQRRKANAANSSGNRTKTKTSDRDKSKDLEKDTDQSSNSDNLLKPPHNAAAVNHINSAADASSPDITSISAHSPLPPTIAPEYIGKQAPASLSNAVRKHFNAQQLSEPETVARFIYVSRQGKSSRGAAMMEGSEGDGDGWWMGSQGREVRRGEGGELGFRLRFRP